MRLVTHNVELGRVVFWNLKNRLPISVNTFASVATRDNPNFLFSICSFDVRILPKIRSQNNEFPIKHSVSSLLEIQAKSGQRMPSSKSLKRISQSSKSVLGKSWCLPGLQPSLRLQIKEHELDSHLYLLLRDRRIDYQSTRHQVKCETKIQTRVKICLKSKMPSCFPPAVFYTSKEPGGLGMIFGSHILIPTTHTYNIFLKLSICSQLTISTCKGT